MWAPGKRPHTRHFQFSVKKGPFATDASKESTNKLHWADDVTTFGTGPEVAPSPENTTQLVRLVIYEI